jgi:hypothetical protein
MALPDHACRSNLALAGRGEPVWSLMVAGLIDEYLLMVRPYASPRDGHHRHCGVENSASAPS